MSKEKFIHPTHREGKYWCDCIVRNYRMWVSKKYYGFNVKRRKTGYDFD